MGVAVTTMAQTEQRTTHIKILGCGVGGRVVDGDSRADQVDRTGLVGGLARCQKGLAHSVKRGW